jgi:uncharacterized protein YjaG (DUF416 family)
MMTVGETPFQQFLNGLEEQLMGLSFPNQLCFGASGCERAYPNYVLFSKTKLWGDPSALRSGLDEAWNIACGEGMSSSRISELEERCKAVTPSSDDFPGADVTAAQEAGFMLTLLLQSCRERLVTYGVRIATFARDTVDLHIQTEEDLDPSDPDLEEKIANHPLMRMELERQKADLAALRLIQHPEDLRRFRAQATAIGVSNIGIRV